MKTLCFIIPVYNEEDVIDDFWVMLHQEIITHNEFDCKIIFINDGSTDKTLQKLKNIQKENPSVVTIITFPSNKGQQKALAAGIVSAHQAQYDLVVLMDSDGQDPPIVAFGMAQQVKHGVDMVYAVRRSSNGENFMKRFLSDSFYNTYNLFAKVKIPPRTSDFRAVNHKVINEVVKYDMENPVFMRAIFTEASKGFVNVPYFFDRNERYAGKTKYNVFKLFTLGMNAIRKTPVKKS